MWLVKRKDGLFSCATEQDYQEAQKIKPGDEVKATRGRNPLFHRKAFALINLGFQNQDRYQLMEVYRKVLIIRAGYYDEVPTKHGEPYYIPKSISYDNMNQETFDKFYEDILRVISEDLETAPDLVKSQLENYY